MSAAPISLPAARARLTLPILVGGTVAGTLDLISAYVAYGRGMPLGIAAGLLGRQAFRGGLGTYILGIFLHHVIAFLAATVYCLASRKLAFLIDNFIVCGIFYGIAVYLVMNLVVLPLCGLHFMGPYRYHGLVQGILIHMFFIGLPISFALNRLSD